MMLPVLVLLLAEDAGPLLRGVAEAARASANWKIEGTIEHQNDYANRTEHFTIRTQGTNKTRFEIDGLTPVTVVCDGSQGWVYSPTLKKYRKEPVDTPQLCSPIVGEWFRLPEALNSAEVAGKCGPEGAGPSSAFALVRGFTEPEVLESGRIERFLCVDRARRAILWERWKNTHGSQIFRYKIAERNDDSDPAQFMFTAPPGSVETTLELPRPKSLGSSGMSGQDAITPPKLVSKKAPKYSDAARAARLEGTTVLWVAVGVDGLPSEVLVYRPFDKDLDEEAVKAVRRWRFKPGARKGEIVALPVFVEVDFRMR